jgi:prolyl 4-hydroxylase
MSNMKGQQRFPSKKDGAKALKETRKSGIRYEFIFALLAIVAAFLIRRNWKSMSEPLNAPTTVSINPQDDGFEEALPDGPTPSNLPYQDSNIPKGANPDGKPRPAVKDCIDRHQECRKFRKNGECHRNPGWMIINCPRSCNDLTDSCRLRDPKLRCDRKALNMSVFPTYQPGDMNRMFESLETRFGNRYGITVISRDPYVVTFDNFISDDEGHALITHIQRWERSTDTGMTNEYGETGRILSQGRTSTNGWCTHECESHPKVQQLFRKIEEVTYVPSKNYESFQVLRYEKNQYYRVHHDSSPEDVQLACGPRILTFFLYLSDVEEGGETAFPQLNIAVKPKKGRALLWPSSLDRNLEETDSRTFHEAKPVKRGTKIAANAWIHLYEYAKPNLWGCTGSFDEL